MRRTAETFLRQPHRKLISPATILGADLIACWDAERPDTITQSGGVVSSWRDTVAGYNLSQGVSGSRPIWSPTSTNLKRPVITPDGTDDQLTLAPVPAAFPVGSNGSEIWWLGDQLQPDTAPDGNLLAYGDATGNAFRDLIRTKNSINNAEADASGVGVTIVATLFFGKFVVRAIFQASTLSLQLNGGALTTAAVTLSTGTTRVRFGANVNGSPAGFAASPTNLILITNPLSTDVAAKVNTFLLARRNV